MLIEIRYKKDTIYVRADEIASVAFPSGRGEAATVVMRSGVHHPCTNPGAVRDAWQKWLTAVPAQAASLFDLIFGK